MVITTPYPFSLLYFLYAVMKFPKTCQNLEHTCWLCPQILEALAERAGLRTVHWRLIEDYQLNDPSGRYRLFVKLLSRFRWLIPTRLRCNTMLFVFEAHMADELIG